MNDMQDGTREALVSLTADIVSAHVSNNSVALADIPSLIESVHKAIAGLTSGKGEAIPAEPLKPAVPIRSSIKHDYIVCLEDGRKLKMLKRHLAVHFNLTPDQYRERWNLPADYPMVAPAYAEKRRELAKAIGLGRSPKSGRRRKASPASTGSAS